MGASSNGSGLYQSDDTGKTWKHLGWDNIKCYSMDMAQSSNRRILYEATGLGILRSVDGGEHWKQITDWRISEAMDVAVNQKNPNEIYIATAHGPWRTRDGGKEWEALLKGLPAPYTSRIIIDSLIDGHILLASEAGIFAINNTEQAWRQIPCEQRNNYGYVEKYATNIRCIVQLSQKRWLAASGDSRELMSSDGAESFATPSRGVDDLWTICEIPLSHGESTAMGGPWGDVISQRERDVIYEMHDDTIKNVSAALEIGIPYPSYPSGPPIQIFAKALFGTLGDGILGNGVKGFQEREIGSSFHTLLGRQIWTLKSFLVTP